MKKCPNCNEPVFKNYVALFIGLRSPKTCSNCGAKITVPTKYAFIELGIFGGIFGLISQLRLWYELPFSIFIVALIVLVVIDSLIYIKCTPLIVQK